MEFLSGTRLIESLCADRFIIVSTVVYNEFIPWILAVVFAS